MSHASSELPLPGHTATRSAQILRLSTWTMKRIDLHLWCILWPEKIEFYTYIMMPVCCFLVTSESSKCQRYTAYTEEPESQVRNSNSFVFTICVTITIWQTNFLDNNMVCLPNMLSSPHCHTCSSIPRAPSTALYQSMFIHSLMASVGIGSLFTIWISWDTPLLPPRPPI